MNWQDEFQGPNEYIAYCHKFVKMLSQFEQIWYDHLRFIEVLQHQIKLNISKDCHIQSAPYGVVPKEI